jgi:Skp family chaperone for outer membrane proteins
MKRLHWSILLVVAALGAALAGANGLKPGPSKVAVCDIRRVVVEYKKFVDLKDAITKQQEAAQGELEKRRQMINGFIDQRKELKRGSADDKKLDDLILEKSVEAQAYGELTRNRLERQQYEGLRECYQNVLAAVDVYAKQNGIDVVLSNRDVKLDEAKNSQDLESLIAARYILFSDAGVDITNDVLKQLNDAYKP